MTTTWQGPRGIEVEVIQLNEKQLFKVTQTGPHGRFLLDYCATIAQVTRHVDLADLVEVIPLPRSHGAP
ncbi:transposase [Nonomuraea angiospora]